MDLTHKKRKLFALNPKCLFISIMIVALYWNLPPKNARAAVVLLFGTYVGIAWYDELYNCDQRLERGVFDAVTGFFKPSTHFS